MRQILLITFSLSVFCTGCGGREVGKEAAQDIKEGLADVRKGLAEIDPAGIKQMLAEVKQLREENKKAGETIAALRLELAGQIPKEIVGKYKNDRGQDTRVDHIDGVRFTFHNGDKSKDELRYDVATNSFVRADGTTACFFFRNARVIVFNGASWKP